MKDSYDDMNFTPPVLARITASTLIVYGDRDFLDPVEMAVEMSRHTRFGALDRAHGGHGPVFLDAKPQFVQPRLPFSEDRNKSLAIGCNIRILASSCLGHKARAIPAV
jgi:pimeloyl-ACP methyl ester carboxylesterase